MTTPTDILNQIAALTASLATAMSVPVTTPPPAPLPTTYTASAPSDVVNIKDFGAVFDGVTDDTAAFQAAMAALPNGGVVLLPMGRTIISQPLITNVPILLKSGVRGDISSNTNGGGYATAKPLIRWAGAAGAYMFTIKPAIVGNVVWGGGASGIEWDGAALAATAVHLDNTKYAHFDGKVRNVTWAGLLISSISGSTGNFSMKNHVPSMEFVWGTADEAKPASGIVMVGNWTNVPSTQQYVGDISGLVYNGDLVRIEATDNAQLGSIHGVVQSGGTGLALNIKNIAGTAQSSNHTSIGYLVGPMRQDNGVLGTMIKHFNSETSGVAQLSGSSSYNAEIVDYQTGSTFKSHTFALRKKIEVRAGDFRSLIRAPMASGDFALQWNTLVWPDGVTSIASAVTPTLYDMEAGVIEGVEILYGSNNPGGGNVRFQVYASTVANGSSGGVVTPEATPLITAAVGGQYVANAVTAVFSPELAFSRGDSLYLSITRLGADAADTNTASIQLLGARILYRSNGPSSSGSGTYVVPQW